MQVLFVYINICFFFKWGKNLKDTVHFCLLGVKKFNTFVPGIIFDILAVKIFNFDHAYYIYVYMNSCVWSMLTFLICLHEKWHVLKIKLTPM